MGAGEASETALVSWLQNNTYYTWLGTSSNDNGEVIFTRTGANDPSFNLRSEPAFILRSKGDTSLFASVVETHGYFNEEFEQSVNARGKVKNIKVLGHTDAASAVEIETEQSLVTLLLSNDANASETTENELTINDKKYNWTGFYSVEIQAIPQETV